MTEELYEELPDGQQDYPEDLYEDLPANELNYPDANQQPYNPNTFVGGVSPPPLPTGPIPTHRPGGPPPPSQPAPPPPPPSQQAPPPPLPTRAPSTTLSAGTTKTLQPHNKKNKPDAKKKGATIARSGGGSSGGGGGIDMSEVLKKARMRSERAIEDLENKRHQREEADSEDKPAAPWLNQLRKTPAVHPKPKPIKETPEVNGTKEDVPEFIRKVRTFSTSQGSDSDTAAPKKPASPPTARKPPPVTNKPPPVTSKPRLPTPSMPTDSNQSEVQDKPAWMKQRERQIRMASETAKPAPGPKPPAALPNGSPAHAVTSSAPPPAKKPRPVPAPRGVTSPKKEHQPPVANGPTGQESPPSVTRVGSVKDRAKNLEREMSGSTSPPPSPKGLPPKPIPPTRTTPTQQVGSAGIVTTVIPPAIQSKPPIAGKPGPPPPVRREFKEPAPPPPAEPPPSSPAPPPIPSKEPPPPPTTAPPPPMAPPPTAPATQGESTPPMVSLQFRRLPLQSVDIFNPPSLPSRDSKPSNAIAVEDIEEDIYDDTVGAVGDTGYNGYDDGEELYDDLAESGMPPPPITPPPSSRPPPPPFSAPPDAPPPLPSGPPPSKVPSAVISPIESESNYETEEMIPTIDEEQETYEDVSVTTGEGGGHLPSSSPSAASLVPPSPQHSISSLSGVPPPSPTLQRNKKLTKEEKKQQEEEKRKEKERKRMEKEREKEKKKKDEIRAKNRAKGIKLFKQFPLKMDMQHLFTVEALLEHPKTKDHLPISEGELLFVLLLAHDKLPDGKYLVEKEDGTIGYVGKNITQRTAYQSTQGALAGEPPSPAGGPVPSGYPEEDIYESLPQDEIPDGGDIPVPMGLGAPPPNLPPPNMPSLLPPSIPSRFPPPSHAPPPPPADGPEELYEELPEDVSDNF